jgi:hypothetical protein
MGIDDADVVRAIADRIARYLERHPEAADSTEGIQRWWLDPDIPAESIDNIELALRHLEASGLVRKSVVGGKAIYRSKS